MLDPELLKQAQAERDRLHELQHDVERARSDYHHTIRRLSASGASLREIAEGLGLSHQRVHQIVDAPTGEVPPPFPFPGMFGRRGRHERRGPGFFERFSDDARRTVVLAQEEARALRHNYVGTEHLLLGLAGETEGIAGQALRAVGAELRLARRAVTAAIAGYTHLKTRQSKEAAAAATISHDMQHINERLSRLEERLAMSAGEVLVTEGPADQVEPPA